MTMTAFGYSHKAAHVVPLLFFIGLAFYLTPGERLDDFKERYSPFDKGWQDDAFPVCEGPGYVTRIVTYDPFIMHIENFVTAEEREYLLELGKPLLQRSHVILNNGISRLDDSRTSSTAFLGKSDPVIQCILERAGQLQGFLSPDSMEEPQLTAYVQGQQYTQHYDWFYEYQVPHLGHENRGSTFFVTLEADCENCGTQFPRVEVDWTHKDPRWCEFVECDDTSALTVKAKPGSAVFWQNLDKEGFGNPRTLHAGLPVRSGSKIGMNIWTRVPTAWSIRQKL